MATKFSPCKGSYVLNQFPSNVMFGMNGFHLSASGAIQGHHGPLVFITSWAYATVKMTTSGQIRKMSYTAYCNTYCNMGQQYCNILQYAFCGIVSPLENTVEKREIACYEQFLFYPQCFQKTCTADT